MRHLGIKLNKTKWCMEEFALICIRRIFIFKIGLSSIIQPDSPALLLPHFPCGAIEFPFTHLETGGKIHGYVLCILLFI